MADQKPLVFEKCMPKKGDPPPSNVFTEPVFAVTWPDNDHLVVGGGGGKKGCGVPSGLSVCNLVRKPVSKQDRITGIQRTGRVDTNDVVVQKILLHPSKPALIACVGGTCMLFALQNGSKRSPSSETKPKSPKARSPRSAAVAKAAALSGDGKATPSPRAVASPRSKIGTPKHSSFSFDRDMCLQHIYSFVADHAEDPCLSAAVWIPAAVEAEYGTLATGGEDGVLRVWDLVSAVFCEHEQGFECAHVCVCVCFV